MHRLFAALALALLAAAPAASQADDAAAARVRAHVEFLASDLLEGRETGSRGHAVAAAYVASQFQALGLKPAGTNGSWYQQVKFRRATHEGSPTIAYTERGRTTALTLGTDAGVRPSVREKVRTIDAPLRFVGRGISDPALGIDDYAGLDARGKIVVALSGAPRGIAGDIASHLDDRKDEMAVAKGAVGFIEIGDDPSSTAPGPGRARVDWINAAGQSGTTAGAAQVQLGLSEQWAQRLFAAAPRPLASLRADAQAGKPIRGFVLPGRFRVQAHSKWEDYSSAQVVALLPGADPALAAEHIVLMGHLDHLGIDRDAKPGTDAISNGAMDNAAGIATMIEAARSFAASGTPPRRSVLFIAVTGEEIGLLGADYFAANPTVPIESIVGLVNLDMPLLTYDFTDVVAFGAEHSTIAPAAAIAVREMGVALSPDPMPEETLFVRSDHYPFVLRGVPSVFLMTGHANGGAEAWRKFLGTVYHKPNDDLSQPIRWRSGARFAELNYRIARTLADAAERPRWYRGDYFGEAFAPGAQRATR